MTKFEFLLEPYMTFRLEKLSLIYAACFALSLVKLCCNTLGVWLPHLHLHFINMSIIHPFMSLDCLEHAFETLQHMFIFHVCLFYEMNSVQHSSATCATHS